jgi:ABC-type microcin C transport system permease subunit YejB
VPFENNVNRLTRKSVFRSAVILVLIGILAALLTLTNHSAMLTATATLLIGVAMIAIASFAGL